MWCFCFADYKGEKGNIEAVRTKASSISKLTGVCGDVAVQRLHKWNYLGVNVISNLPLGRRVMSGSSATGVPGTSVSR